MGATMAKSFIATALALAVAGLAQADGPRHAPKKPAAKAQPAAAKAHQDDGFRVALDYSSPLPLKGVAAAIVIGNPSIAGVSVQSDKLLFVTGRSYGSTNLIVLGAAGETLLRTRITVVPDEDNALMLIKGVGQIRYDCTPLCRRRPDPTDEQTAWERGTKQGQEWGQIASQANQGR